MILNHQSKREGSAEYEARVAALLQSYASPRTTIEVHYPEDLGGSEVTSDLLVERMLAVGKELMAEGAHALIPLGGRLVPYVVSPLELEAELKVPVINTKLVGIRHAETLVNGKTSHSIKSYPWSEGLAPENISRRAVE